VKQEEQNQEVEPESEGETVRKSGLAYAAAFTLFSTVAVLLGAGYLLDRWLGSSPWGIVGGIVLGSVVGFYQFVRITSKIYK
jgi:ATP synthase protein I